VTIDLDPIDINDDSRSSIVIINEPVPVILSKVIFGKVIFNSKDYGVIQICSHVADPTS
jgi:hypothetical protein